MIPTTNLQYDCFLETQNKKYNKSFEKFNYPKNHLNIETLPLWVNALLTNLSYSNEEKDKFVEDFLILYINDKEFRNDQEGNGIIFANMNGYFYYIGFFDYQTICEYENKENYNIVCHRILLNNICSENLEAEYEQKEITIFLKGYSKKPYATDQTFETKSICTNVSLKTKNNLSHKIKNNLSQKTEKYVVDTGCSITYFPYRDFWDAINGIFTPNDSDFFNYLNSIKERVEYISCNGNTGDSIKQVILFKEYVYVNIQNLSIPLRRFAIAHSECDSLLLGMDSISQCNIFSYIQNGKQKLHMESRNKNKAYFLNRIYDEGLILSKSSEMSRDIYIINSYEENSRWYKTTNKLNILEIETVQFRNLFRAKFMDIENGELNFQDTTYGFQVILDNFDGILFKWSDKNCIILSKKYKNIERINNLQPLIAEDLERFIGMYNYNISQLKM